jgi:hypothetical protein
MAAHAMRFPRRRRWPQRLAGLVGTLALLGSGAAIAVMVMPEKKQAAVPAPAPGAAVKGASKTKAPLTAAQKRARRTAVAKLTDEGYEPVRLADWRPGAALKVLVGRAETGAMRAFFFAGGEFVGYDDPATSNNLRVAKASRDAVTLAYRVSTGSTEKVRFVWRDGALEPTTTVPLASIR